MRIFQTQGIAPLREGLSASAQLIIEEMAENGSLFLDEIIEATGLLPSAAEKGLRELVSRGWVYSDGFSGLEVYWFPSSEDRNTAHTDLGWMKPDAGTSHSP